MSCIIRMPETALNYELEENIFNYITSKRPLYIDNSEQFILLNNEYKFDEINIIDDIIGLNIEKLEKLDRNLFIKTLNKNNINYDIVIDDRIVYKGRGCINDNNFTLEEICNRNKNFNISFDVVKNICNKNITYIKNRLDEDLRICHNESTNILFAREILNKCNYILYNEDDDYSNIIINPLLQQYDDDSNIKRIVYNSIDTKYTQNDLQNAIRYFGIDGMYYFCNNSKKKIYAGKDVTYNGIIMDIWGVNFLEERMNDTLLNYY